MTLKAFSLLAVLFFLPFRCSHDCEPEGRCMLEPETGDCDAAFVRYYYDQDEGTCKEFIWGGCGGVVPFETLEACQAECECSE